MAEPTMKELRAQAKERGINSFGMKKADLMAAVAEDGTPEPVNPRDARATGREETGRRRRIPLGTASLKMAYADRPGYHRHWMNDRSNRIHAAEQAGYTFVEAFNDGRKEKVSRRVGSHEDGSPMSAYLMEIRQEFYDEDQKAKQVRIDEIDDAIMRPDQPNDAEPDRAGFYTPSEGTSMSVETSNPLELKHGKC